MEFKNLAITDIADIVDCLNKSFQGYYVKIPSEVDFWSTRFISARVDYSLSFGVFDQQKLVAFIIHGLDIHNSELTAFNTGTGVLEAYRGQQLVDKMYNFAFPLLRSKGIKKCLLEVIDQNHRAIKVYERIGFQKNRFLRCFNGDLMELKLNSQFQEVDIMGIKENINKYQNLYAWDSSIDSVIHGGKIFKTYLVKDEGNIELGYFILNAVSGSLVQIQAFKNQDWLQVISAIKKITSSIRINNVEENRVDLITSLKKTGIENHINQFEMTLYI